jgi:hypothetical protein
MGRSDCLADMNGVYVRTDVERKGQPAIHLWHLEERFGSLSVQKERARTQHTVPTNHLANMDGPSAPRHQPKQ